MEKALEIQKQIWDNGKTLNSYMTDLQNWEAEMKRKEAALSGELEQAIPPVRSKAKKEKPVLVKKSPEPRISASDYLSWEKFDVEKACEDIDMTDAGPPSLDSKKSQSAKMDKFREEAQHEKERGNNFVKQEKWDDAISCYNRAIELVKDDAIYFANRGLCYLKKESLHQAEADCTEALRLDPTYVKALQRRASARERLGSLRAASNDLAEVLNLEPKNKAALTQLEQIKARMGTKGAKSKSSPSSTPTAETFSFAPSATRPKIIELDDPKPTLDETLADWMNGVGENVSVLRPVKKPPHLRSKRGLKSIPIKEILLGEPSPDMKCITEIDRHNAGGDVAIPESAKLVGDEKAAEKCRLVRLLPPVNSVQFMAQWKQLKGQDQDRSLYLSIIDPANIPAIFANALESDVLAELVRALHLARARFTRRAGGEGRGAGQGAGPGEGRGVTAYLHAFARVRRFPALTMFLSAHDQQLILDLLEHCKTFENCSDETIDDLKNKYEL